LQEGGAGFAISPDLIDAIDGSFWESAGDVIEITLGTPALSYFVHETPLHSRMYLDVWA
jgi:hypothetical protein